MSNFHQDGSGENSISYQALQMTVHNSTPSIKWEVIRTQDRIEEIKACYVPNLNIQEARTPLSKMYLRVVWGKYGLGKEGRACYLFSEIPCTRGNKEVLGYSTKTSEDWKQITSAPLGEAKFYYVETSYGGDVDALRRFINVLQIKAEQSKAFVIVGLKTEYPLQTTLPNKFVDYLEQMPPCRDFILSYLRYKLRRQLQTEEDEKVRLSLTLERFTTVGDMYVVAENLLTEFENSTVHSPSEPTSPQPIELKLNAGYEERMELLVSTHIPEALTLFVLLLFYGSSSEEMESLRKKLCAIREPITEELPELNMEFLRSWGLRLLVRDDKQIIGVERGLNREACLKVLWKGLRPQHETRIWEWLQEVVRACGKEDSSFRLGAFAPEAFVLLSDGELPQTRLVELAKSTKEQVRFVVGMILRHFWENEANQSAVQKLLAEWVHASTRETWTLQWTVLDFWEALFWEQKQRREPIPPQWFESALQSMKAIWDNKPKNEILYSKMLACLQEMCVATAQVEQVLQTLLDWQPDPTADYHQLQRWCALAVGFLRRTSPPYTVSYSCIQMGYSIKVENHVGRLMIEVFKCDNCIETTATSPLHALKQWINQMDYDLIAKEILPQENQGAEELNERCREALKRLTKRLIGDQRLKPMLKTHLRQMCKPVKPEDPPVFANELFEHLFGTAN